VSTFVCKITGKNRFFSLSQFPRKREIPCSLNGGRALLTDEEITELKENYSELAIEDYIEPTPSIVGPIQGCDE